MYCTTHTHTQVIYVHICSIVSVQWWRECEQHSTMPPDFVSLTFDCVAHCTQHHTTKRSFVAAKHWNVQLKLISITINANFIGFSFALNPSYHAIQCYAIRQAIHFLLPATATTLKAIFRLHAITCVHKMAQCSQLSYCKTHLHPEFFFSSFTFAFEIVVISANAEKYISFSRDFELDELE